MGTRTKLALAGVLALAVLGALAFSIFHKTAPPPVAPVEAPSWPVSEVIGTSTEGRAITAYTYGTGSTKLLFVGGMHGGYEWNSVLLAYQFVDYLKANPTVVPATVSVTVIPSLNPDGVFKVTGSNGRFTEAQVSSDAKVTAAGRFNARAVDLNRNLDCNWQATSTWQGRTVSAGTAPFSEPETEALRALVLAQHPAAVVFWHSAANAVYASECNDGVLPNTLTLMNTYATAAKYPAVRSFDAYPITGDSEGWLASIGIPAITVEMATHQAVEWERNLAGITALLSLYGSK